MAKDCTDLCTGGMTGNYPCGCTAFYSCSHGEYVGTQYCPEGIPACYGLEPSVGVTSCRWSTVSVGPHIVKLSQNVTNNAKSKKITQKVIYFSHEKRLNT